MMIKEDELVKSMFAEIQKLRDSHPDYFAWFEDVDPDTASRSDLTDLMVSAPTEQVKFFLFGKFSMRLMIATVTGREFK